MQLFSIAPTAWQNGYAWSMEKVETGNTASIQEKETASEGFKPVAARQLVTGLSKKIEANQVAQLDAIHALAKTYEIVTPYSSMIVLVNDEQREALKQAEAEKDRFERKVEDGKERLTQPNNPLSVSVPEPGMLVGLVAIALFLMVSRQRRTINSIISADFSKETDN